MGENNLTAIVLSPSNVDFNDQYRVLTVRGSQSFTVGIKEYEDAKKSLSEKIKKVETELTNIDPNLEKEKQRLGQEALDRYNKGGDWQKGEKYNGEIVSRAEVTLNANKKQSEKIAAALKKKKDAELSSLNNELSNLENTYSKVVWAYNLAKQRTDQPIGKNINLESGHTLHNFSLGPHILGGGFVWLEPFWDKPESKPTGSIKNGIYIHSDTEGFNIKIAEWYHVDDNKKLTKTTTPVKIGSFVELHIYTQNLYGQNLGVMLKGNGKVLKANTYKVVYQQQIIPEKAKAPYEVDESKEYFFTEVELHSSSDENSPQVPPGAIQGNLAVDKKDYPIVQKAVLQLYIDPVWCLDPFSFFNTLTIVPTVKFKDKEIVLSQATLTVKRDSLANITIPQAGNKVVVVDKVETNFEAFHHCRYDVIIGSYSKLDEREDNEPVEIQIFDSKDGLETAMLYMPVIAGNKQARRNVKIKVDANTNECSFDGDKLRDHEKRVFDLSLIQEAVVVEKSTRVDENLVFSKNSIKLEDLRMTFTKEEEGHGDTNDDNEINATHSTGKGSVKGPVGMTSTSKTTTFKDDRKIGRYPNSDTELILDVGYKYEGSLINYIWPTRQAILQKYPILLHTCAYPDKTLNIMVYPDIKWVLQFAYDCDPDEFNEMRGDAYDKYLVKVEKLEGKYKPEEIESKISRTDADLENARENLRTAKKENKKNAKKLIAKLEAKKAKQEAKSKKYNKETSKAKKVYKKDRPDLFNFKENITSGLSDLVLSLNVEYDRPGEAIEISASYKRYVNLVKQIIDVKNTVELILDGKKKSKKKLDKKFREIDEKDAAAKLKNMGEALKGRPLISVDIIPPSLAVLGSWYAESPKDINTNQVGIVGEIQVMAKPFIGAAITMDFLALAQKAHPIARGIITVIDVAEAAGIGPKITFEMEVSGELEIEGKLMYNSASGNTNFNQNALSKDAEDDSPLTVSGVFKLEIKGKIEFSKKANSYIFGSVTAYANAGFEVKTGLTLSGAIKADEKGFFIDPLLTFHGLIVSGVAEAGYKVENSDGGEYFSDSIEGSFELVLMHEYEGRFENSNGEKVQLYLT